MKYVLDTNVFNRVLDGRFALASIPDASGFIATTVQIRELESTRDPTRRTDLLKIFVQVSPAMSLPAFSFDVPGAGFGEGEWSADERITEIWKELEAAKSKRNNWQDALIAGVALKHECGLITSDGPLADVATKYGIKVCHVVA